MTSLFEVQGPYFTVSAQDPYYAILAIHLLSPDHEHIICYDNEDIIPSYRNIDEYMKNIYSVDNIEDEIVKILRFQRDNLMGVLRSFQPGDWGSTEDYKINNPTVDINNFEVKKERVYNDHPHCLFEFINYAQFVNAFDNGFILV
jgi:hypothetical protein